MSSNLQVPSEEEWGNYKEDLDRKYAHKMFSGKSHEQVISRFEDNIIEAVDELRFMPPIPFRYYMLALRNYMVSKLVLANPMVSDAASCFLRLVAEKLRETPNFIFPIIGDLMPAIEYVATNQKLFDADIDIYGDFAEKLTEIKGLLALMSDKHGKE